MSDTKYCLGCKQEIDRAMFQKDKRSKDKLGSRCRPCINIARKDALNVDAARKRFLKWKYGMTMQDYMEIYLAQQGRCAVCNSFARGNRDWLDVDHDHKTGRIRGLLCSPCNLALGSLEDDATRIEALLTYVLKQTIVERGDTSHVEAR